MGGYSNPFDVPLNSEIEESRQRQQANQSANGNPFDEPLASEVAERAHTEAKQHLSDNGNPFDVPLDSEIAEQKQAEARQANPEQYASDTRQMLVSGLTGMPTPNMTDADRASFASGKAAGALSVPVVTGATVGATAASEAIPSLVDKAKTIVEWAKTNPIKAATLEGIAREIGVDPFQLVHSAIKYGKNLFGVSEGSK
jgi:hypothetical protein